MREGDSLRLLLRTRILLRAALCWQRCSFFATRQRTNQENAPRRSPWEPPALPHYKPHQEINILFLDAVLQVLSTRAADRESRSFGSEMSASFITRARKRCRCNLLRHNQKSFSFSWRIAGFQRAPGPLADFLSSFLCSATKKGHEKRDRRTRAKGTV